MPSKHLAGAAYVNTEKRQLAVNQDQTVNGKKRKKVSAKPQAKAGGFDAKINITHGQKYTDLKFPVLEMFLFRRLVIDEHTYADGQLGVILEYLMAPHSWILSGTPPSANHNDIKSLAKFIGINLGITDFSSLKRNDLTGKPKDPQLIPAILTPP